MGTTENVLNPLEIEEMEKDILFRFGWLFKNSLNDFSTAVDRSLGYLDQIVLPTIMASKRDKSYNPFSEIIEKYAIHILVNKLEKDNYQLLPLGYSADLTLEKSDHILNIDIKTANLDNPSDFRKTINIGINQMTHVAKLPINGAHLPDPYFVYPTIPPFYKFPNGQIKLVLTYGLLFIYPPYSDLVRDIREDYNRLFGFFTEKVKSALIPILSQTLRVSRQRAEELLNRKPPKGSSPRKNIIAENIIRGIFIHEQQRNKLLSSLNITEEDKTVMETFSKELKEFTDKLRERDVKPIAIIAISIPNGLLSEYYLNKFVSGKNYGKSARYHYEDGIFEVIKKETGKEIPRVIFLDINMGYLDKLKKHFDKITILDYELKVL